MAKNLVIVESPAKAKTINKYLGSDFVVKASMGHVRDLPKKTLGVDVKKGFAAEYEVLPTRKKVLDELKAAAKDATAIFLAADPDREGEAICWHLSEALGGRSKKKYRRVIFNEITKKAVQAAFDNPGEVDSKKVDAQQTRRILDRLVGYKVSPILWDKVRRGLSAGRVQSVALRLLCEREREIKAFVAEEYWTVLAHLAAAQPPVFPANLVKKDGKNVEIGNAQGAAAIRADLEAASFKVQKVQAKERRRFPVPPFITSKLQQEAFKKLRFSVKKTMQVAQRLYEGIELGSDGSVGLITYMRTDSTRIADDAIAAVRSRIGSMYGPEHVPEKPLFYKSKKDAQDAHEAIRPTYLDRDPESVKRFLGKDELALYRLIWNRFVASQMKPALYDETIVDIEAAAYLVRAKGSTLKFKGFLVVYEESPDERHEEKPKDENAAAQADDTAPEEAGAQLPPLAEGDVLTLGKLDTDQHFTQPPPRFSEASLVKELEENGIGRPSTYASIIATIEAREYMEKREAKLYPTELGFLVTDLLVEHFQDIMNVGYTAEIEKELDEIEEGKDNLLNTLSQFWKKFEKDLKLASKQMKDVKAMEEKTDEVCDKCGSPMVIKWGRHGSFLACTGYPDCRNSKPYPVGIPCPDCTVGEVVERSSRFGKIFYSCSRYPDCRFASWGRPIAQSCPACGYPAMAERVRKDGSTHIACLRKGCKGRAVDPAPAKSEEAS